MSTVTARPYLGAVDLRGLLALDGVIDALIEAFADGDRLEFLTQGAEAKKLLEGDVYGEDKALAQARLDEAREGLSLELAGRAVRLDRQVAIALRRVLQGARLGEGRQDDWQARRVA